MPYILIVAIMSGFLFALIPQQKAEAIAPIVILGGIALWQYIGSQIGIPTPLSLTLDLANWTLPYILSGIGWFFFEMASGVLSISGYLFDVAIEKTITLNEFIRDLPAIKEGWTLSRDVANLFFIFIILYIAIATILRLSGYGIKDLLVKVVIIALMVNFSLMITQVIIDASNILALEFYNSMKISTKALTSGTDDNGVSFQAGDTIQVVSPSSVFMGALRFERIFKTEGQGLSGFFKSTGPGDYKLAIVLFMGTIVMVVIAFVFFAISILFVIRTIALIFLMVIAPLAFLAMALPATRQYGSRWWNALFKQAFFAPVCLFLLYLSAGIVSSENFVTITDSQVAGFAGALTGNPSEFGIIFSYILIIGLLLGSLIVAKEMGAYGADTVQKWGKDARKWGQGYAGRISKRYTAPVAERLASGTEKTGWGRVVGSGLRKVPLATKGLAKAGTWDKPEIKKYEKQYSSYSPAALANIKASPRLNLLNRTQKQAIENIEKKRKKKVEEEEILKTGTSMDKVKILAKREKEAREEAESKLEAGKAAPKPKETTEKT